MPKSENGVLGHRLGNWFVERSSKALVEAAISLIAQHNLPNRIDDMLNLNRSIMYNHFGKTPYELINNRIPNIGVNLEQKRMRSSSLDILKQRRYTKFTTKRQRQTEKASMSPPVRKVQKWVLSHPGNSEDVTIEESMNLSGPSTDVTNDVSDAPPSSLQTPNIEFIETLSHVDGEVNPKPSSENDQEILLYATKSTRYHQIHEVVGDPSLPVQIRFETTNEFINMEPTRSSEALEDLDWVIVMQDEFNQPISAQERSRYLRKKKNESGIILRNKAGLAANGYRQQEGID
ncbi:hypothetical protein OSB04_008374 [Centaurea solstitialis]|uniref:Uncharacterized protein n=1 Tax=Centaurea solstitialis TaxID=347529 RepID=A0AA38TND9_9ASTR|nr:hypothetical protein OSB04_008374 [Centaurea solstitialis]